MANTKKNFKSTSTTHASSKRQKLSSVATTSSSANPTAIAVCIDTTTTTTNTNINNVVPTYEPDCKEENEEDSEEEDGHASEPTFGEKLLSTTAITTSKTTIKEKITTLSPSVVSNYKNGTDVASTDFPLTISSLHLVLSQALKSGDEALLESVLTGAHTSNVVSESVARLPHALALTLIESMVVRIERRPLRAGQLLGWVRAAVSEHYGYLMTVPDIVRKLAPFYRYLEARAENYKALLKLQGRLQLVLQQGRYKYVDNANSEKNLNAPRVVVYSNDASVASCKIQTAANLKTSPSTRVEEAKNNATFANNIKLLNGFAVGNTKTNAKNIHGDENNDSINDNATYEDMSNPSANPENKHRHVNRRASRSSLAQFSVTRNSNSNSNKSGIIENAIENRNFDTLKSAKEESEYEYRNRHEVDHNDSDNSSIFNKMDIDEQQDFNSDGELRNETQACIAMSSRKMKDTDFAGRDGEQESCREMQEESDEEEINEEDNVVDDIGSIASSHTSDSDCDTERDSVISMAMELDQNTPKAVRMGKRSKVFIAQKECGPRAKKSATVIADGESDSDSDDNDNSYCNSDYKNITSPELLHQQ